MPEERFALHEPLHRAHCSTASSTDAHRELQQLLERFPLQQRSRRTPGDAEEADRSVSMRQNRDDSVSLYSERAGQV